MKREEGGKQGVGSRVAAGVILIAAVGVVVAAAYYQQELSNYWRLQGWDPGAVKQTMDRFVREGHDGQPSAGDLLDPKWGEPVVESGKFVGVRHSGALGPHVTRVTTMLPGAEMKDFSVRIKNKSGVFQADVQFSNGLWGQFDVDRVNGALRIRTVPDALSSTRPQPQPWD